MIVLYGGDSKFAEWGLYSAPYRVVPSLASTWNISGNSSWSFLNLGAVCSNPCFVFFFQVYFSLIKPYLMIFSLVCVLNICRHPIESCQYSLFPGWSSRTSIQVTASKLVFLGNFRWINLSECNKFAWIHIKGAFDEYRAIWNERWSIHLYHILYEAMRLIIYNSPLPHLINYLLP